MERLDPPARATSSSRPPSKTVEMLRGRSFDVVYRETDGGHTWDTWREHFNEFAPQRLR